MEISSKPTSGQLFGPACGLGRCLSTDNCRFLAKMRGGQEFDGEDSTLETEDATTAPPQTPADLVDQCKQYWSTSN